jgi:hypothetical protein
MIEDGEEQIVHKVQSYYNWILKDPHAISLEPNLVSAIELFMINATRQMFYFASDLLLHRV